MWLVNRDGYDLLMSEDPCEVFYYFEVYEMHGLNVEIVNCTKIRNKVLILQDGVTMNQRKITTTMKRINDSCL
jgi:hypothetical protein